MRCIIMTAVGAAMCTAPAASAGMAVIDGFTDQFDSEAWIFSAGTYVNSIGERSGLEVGYLALAEGYEVGDEWGGSVPRTRETQEHFGLAGVYGGHRYADLQASNPDSMGSDVSVGVWNGVMSFSTAFGTHGILNLTYEGDGGLNLDVSGDALFGAIKFDLVSGDLDQANDQYDRPVPISISLTSGLGTGGEVTHSLSDHLLAERGYEFMLADYAAAGIDLSDIDRVSILIDQSDPSLAAVDFAINAIGIGTGEVPSPGGLALLGTAGLLAARRRR
jgi:hypothetical protein